MNIPNYQADPAVIMLFHRVWQKIPPPTTTKDRLMRTAEKVTHGPSLIERATANLRREALLMKIRQMTTPNHSCVTLDPEAWDGHIVEEAVEHYRTNHSGHPFCVELAESPATLAGITTALLATPGELSEINSATGAGATQIAVNRTTNRLLNIATDRRHALHMNYDISPELSDAIRAGSIDMNSALAVAGNICESGLTSWEICVPKNGDAIMETIEDRIDSAATEFAQQFLMAAEGHCVSFADAAVEDCEVKLLTKTADPGDFARWRWLTMPDPLHG